MEISKILKRRYQTQEQNTAAQLLCAIKKVVYKRNLAEIRCFCAGV